MNLFRSFFLLALFIAPYAFPSSASARDRHKNLEVSEQGPGDERLIQAVKSRRQKFYIEASGLVVSKILPDDRVGRKHQKFMVRLSNGSEVLVVYNIEMCPRVPIREGDIVALGGHFVWAQQGPLMHWLHYDPSFRRPHGYVELRGTRYCFQPR